MRIFVKIASADCMSSRSAKSDNPLAVIPTKRQHKRYTLGEFLEKEAKETRKHENYNGKIVAMPYAKGPHNLISGNITTALNNAIDQAGTNFLVLTSDQMIYSVAENTGLYADTLVIAERMEFYDDNQVLLINPLLIVETLSPSTQLQDVYKRCEGLR